MANQDRTEFLSVTGWVSSGFVTPDDEETKLMVTCFLFILCVAANRKRRTNYRFTEIATCEIIAAVQLHCYTFNTPIRSTGIKQKRNGNFQIGFINKHVLIGRKRKT